jgi:uncharacterized membrane protein
MTNPVTILLLFLIEIPIVTASPLAYGVFTVPGSSYTAAWGVNNSGAIAGVYSNGLGGEHGFIRSPDGNTYTTIDFPGSLGTTVFGINNDGDVAGTYTFLGSDAHAFVRSANGNYVSFDVPGLDLFTLLGINDSGQVVGSTNGQGFIRNSNGVYSTFDVPGQPNHCCYEPSGGINDAGVVVGTTDDAGVLHDFIRNADGSQYFVFDPPGTSASALFGINNQGEIVGFSFVNSHSFLRSADGNNYTTLPDIPFPAGSILIAHGINDLEEIVGPFGDFGASSFSFCTGPCAGSIQPFPEVGTLSMCIIAVGGFTLLGLIKSERFKQGKDSSDN